MADKAPAIPDQTFEILNGTATLTVTGKGSSHITNRGNEFASMNPTTDASMLDNEGKKLLAKRSK